jgi:Domain of unknown function (DUF3854)
VNPHLRLLLSPVYDGALAPEHRADLEKSGLMEATLRAQRIRSVPPKMIRSLLGWDSPAIRSAYLLPFLDPPTPLAWLDPPRWMDHVRLRLFWTEARKKPIKYGQPRGSGSRLYFPCLGLPRILSGDEPLVLVEGEKKCLAVSQLGRPAVGFCGVWNWRDPQTHALLPDFDHIPLDRRRVELLPDGDVVTNPDVAAAMERLAEALEAQGARVVLIVLPGLVPPDEAEGAA